MMYEMAPKANETATLEDYLEAIKARKLLVLATSLILLLAAFLVASNRTETFEAKASILVNPSPTGSAVANRLVEPNLDREVAILVSDAVAEDAVAALGTNDNPQDLAADVEPEFLPDSDVLSVVFVDPNPVRAAAVSNAFANAYVENRTTDQNEFYEERAGALTAAIALLEEDQTSAVEAIAVLDAQRQEIADNQDLSLEERRIQLSDNSSQRQVVVTERNAVAAEIRSLRNNLTSIETNRNSEAPAATLLSTAQTPTSALGLGTAVISVAGLLTGLVLGVVLAFLLARLDRSAKDEGEITSALATQLIGAIPDLGWRQKQSNELAMNSSRQNPRLYRAREAYRLMRSSVEFLQRSNSIKSLLITSSRPGEGKTTTCANLAIALASGGQTVAVVNADMRRPSLEKMFGMSNSSIGLSSFLGGATDELELLSVDGTDGLYIVPAGPLPANPGELLASPRFATLIEELTSQVDLVIVDTPPVGSTADSVAASSAVGAVLIVVDAKSASQSELRTTRADLDRAGANVVGAVMNRDRSRDAKFFSRKNSYAYAYEKQEAA